MAESLPSSGHIDPKSFPFTLVDFHRQGATGSLKVEGDNRLKALYFRGGRVLFGSSNDPKDQLGAILIESGKITEQQLEDVNQKVGPGNPLAKALTESGIVSQRELSDAARAKVERILSDVLSYSAGSFEFEDGVLPKGAVDLKLSPERLFMGAVRRVSDRGFVLRHLDGLDVVLSTKPELQEKLPEIESELGGLEGHLDGLISLKEAAGRAALDEFEAAKIACGLLFLGLAEKGPAVVVGGAEASPFFVPAEEGAELDLGQSAALSPAPEEPAPTIAFGSAPEEAESPIVVDSEAFSPSPAEATVVMGDVPSFSLPSLSSPPAPERLPVVAAPPPPEPPARSSEPAPLKIIAPPRPAERSRPPSKPSRDDLAALDELLGKRSPEGPLTPIQKPAEEWKPTFLPEQTTRGRKRRNDNRKLLVGVGTGFVVLAAAAAGWMIWSNRASGASGKAAARPAAVPTASPSSRVAAASPVAGVATAAASPTPASASPSAPLVPSPAASSVATGPSAASGKPAAAPATLTTTVPAAKPAPPSSSPKATPAPAKPSGGGAGLDEPRSLLRKGRFDEAARGFQSHLKSSKASHSVQILVACSTDTLQKAVSAVPADDLYVLPVHYRGKDCYRVGWGLYESEAKANAGARAVPDYFRQGGARPKVVPLAELLH